VDSPPPADISFATTSPSPLDPPMTKALMFLNSLFLTSFESLEILRFFEGFGQRNDSIIATKVLPLTEIFKRLKRLSLFETPKTGLVSFLLISTVSRAKSECNPGHAYQLSERLHLFRKLLFFHIFTYIQAH